MKILVVDDESLVRRALSRACRSRGHVVEEASGGIEGIDKWNSMQPDLVFLDVLMPDMNGPKVIENVSASKNTKIVLMSAYTGGYDLNKAQSVGADLFLSKPFDNIFKTVEIAESICSER